MKSVITDSKQSFHFVGEETENGRREEASNYFDN